MADTNKILTAAAVLETPRIKGKLKHTPTFSLEELKADTDRYWKQEDKAAKRRKMFPVEYWQLDKLIEATGQIGLVVRNISKPREVTAQWIAFFPTQHPELGDDDRCFVLSEPFYSGKIELVGGGNTTTHDVRGLKQVKTPKMASNFLVALLGRNAKKEYRVFLQNVSINLIEDPHTPGPSPAPGGEGAGGVKVPP